MYVFMNIYLYIRICTGRYDTTMLCLTRYRASNDVRLAAVKE